jgi:hypothetical protein
LLLEAGAEMSDMNRKLLAAFLSVILVAMLPGLSLGQDAQNYQCTHGDLQRRVEILYETGLTVPCEVHYYKDTEAPGEMQVLWRAVNQSGYCEMKTQEFITKLTELGWSCSQGVESEPEPEPEQESKPDDDTDELTPAEETESNADQ